MSKIYKQTPIIVISTQAAALDEQGLREAGATGSLAKPVDFGKMAEVLQEHLKIKP